METGKFYLNIYFSEGEEDHSDSSNDFKYFRAWYVNPYENELDKYLKGEVIKEEDEDEEEFDKDFKEVLRIK